MSELITHFGIDWKLLLAQAINFLILLIILKKFAYGPILQMLKKRREEIERGVRLTQEAESARKQADQLKEKILNQAKTEALSIVSGSEKIGEKRKEEIIATADKKAEIIIEEAKKIIEQEKAKMGESVYDNAQELIKLALAKILGKMPEGARDAYLIQEAVDELKKEYH